MRGGLLGALVAVALTVACSGSGKDTGSHGIADGVYTPNDVTLIAPSSTLGTISGQVVDGTGAPIASASVKAALPGGVQTTSTDANGAFAFSKVPGGTTVGITLTKMGYTTGTATATVPDNAGNVPEENTNAFVGPIALFATTGTLTVTVVGYDGSLVAAPGIAVVSPAYGTPAASGAGTSYGGSTTVSATSGNGVISFTGIPDLEQLAALGSGAATISVALDPSSSNSVNYGGGTLYLSVAEALSSPGLLSLVLPDTSQGAAALAIVGSGVGSLVNGPGSPTDSLVNPSNAVSLAFNQPVTATTVGVTLIRDDGVSDQAMTTVSATMDPNVVTFTDSNIQPGRGYQITVQAAASNSHPEAQKTFAGQMFTAPSESAPQLLHAYFTPGSTGELEPGGTVSVILDSPVGLAGGSPVLAAYFDANISTTGGNSRTLQGEYDATGVSKAGGWPLTPDPAYPLLNGFSTHFLFTYSGASVAAVTPGSTHPVLVLFDDPLTAGDTALTWLNGLPLNVGNSPGMNNEANLEPAP